MPNRAHGPYKQFQLKTVQALQQNDVIVVQPKIVVLNIASALLNPGNCKAFSSCHHKSS